MGNVHGCMGVPAVRIQISLGVLVLDLGTLFDIMLINMQLLSKAADNTSLASLQMYSEKDGKGEERDGSLGKTGGGGVKLMGSTVFKGVVFLYSKSFPTAKPLAHAFPSKNMIYYT